MARLVDESKMDRIKSATIELIVEKGYGGASISAIGKKAGVAEGYLYRFYASKQSLVNHLLHSKIASLTAKIASLLESMGNTNEILSTLVASLFEMAKDQPRDIKFLYVLMHDYNFLIPDEQRDEIKGLTQRINQLGKKSGEIGFEVQDEEVYHMSITYPIVFLNMRLKGFFGNNSWNSQDLSRVTSFCINTLK